MRLARQLLQILQRSGSTWSPLHGPPQAGAGDGRDPRLRLAGVPPAGLGPRGNLLVPPAGRLGPDQRLTPKRLVCLGGRLGTPGRRLLLPVGEVVVPVRFGVNSSEPFVVCISVDASFKERSV